MSREYQTNGVTLVKVKGAVGTSIANVQELGLANDQITITPRWRHMDIYEDGFGPQIPPEVMWLLADVTISMTLNHVDSDILKTCINESMAGSQDGILAPAGRPMGGGKGLFEAENHYISLNLLGGNPWRFPAAFLAERPVEWPIGTLVSNIKLIWRAIPYAYPKRLNTDFIQIKYPLWSREIDLPPE